MKTTADQIQILYDLLKTSSLNTALNGGLYKMERPQNSQLEDIVVSSMLVGDGGFQEGVANVNIYIPKMDVSIGGQLQKMANTGRISTVWSLATLALEENSGSTYNCWCSRTQEFDEPLINQTRLSLRIEFRLFI